MRRCQLEPLHWKKMENEESKRHLPPAASGATTTWTSPLTLSQPRFRWISGKIAGFCRLAKPSSDGDVCPEWITLSPARLLGKSQHPLMKCQNFPTLFPMRRSRERSHASLWRCDLQQRAVSRAHHSLVISSLSAPMFPVTL